MKSPCLCDATNQLTPGYRSVTPQQLNAGSDHFLTERKVINAFGEAHQDWFLTDTSTK